MEFLITPEGTIVNVINGFFAFWIMRFAHKVTTDPVFEKKVWKKIDDKKLKNKQKKHQ